MLPPMPIVRRSISNHHAERRSTLYPRRRAQRSSPPPEDRPKLVDLPNEIFPQIFTYLDELALFRVSRLTRRLNDLALYELVCRHEIPGAPQAISGALAVSSFAAIRAFRLALPVAPLEQLLCTFSGDATMSDLHELQSTVHALPRIRELSIDFGEDLLGSHREELEAVEMGHWQVDDLVDDDECFVRIPNERISTFIKHLIYSVSQHSTAVMIVTRDGLLVSKPQHVIRWKLHVDLDAEEWGASSGSPGRSSSIELPDGPHKDWPYLRSCETLTAQNPFSAPGFRAWSIVTVNASTIVTLNLSLPLRPDDWSSILPGITLPNLASAIISAKQLSIHDSTLFLNRHPAVVCLSYLVCPLATPSLPLPQIPKLDLPRLRCLTACPSYINYCMTVTRDSLSEVAITLIHHK